MNKKSKIEVFNGIDCVESAVDFFKNQKIGLLSSASGVTKEGIFSGEILGNYGKVEVMFSPEHGINANLQDGMYSKSNFDEELNAFVYDAGVLRNPADCGEIFDKIDVVAYDIQDVGARYYTYLYNLTDLMICCAEYKKSLVVFDRINIIGGHKVQGAILNSDKLSSSIGRYKIPVRYGLTVGEFANMINKTQNIGCDLHIVKCKGWQRDVYLDETDLLFVNPSPNIPSNNCAFNYIGTCIFEATNVSEGRGTTKPFDMIGAPFVNANKLCEYMNSKKLQGTVFRKTCFTPKFNKFENEVCNGIEIHITDREAYDPIATGLYIFSHFLCYKEFSYNKDGLAKRFGNYSVCNESLADNDAEINNIILNCRKESEKFAKESAAYYIY